MPFHAMTVLKVTSYKNTKLKSNKDYLAPFLQQGTMTDTLKNRTDSIDGLLFLRGVQGFAPSFCTVLTDLLLIFHVVLIHIWLDTDMWGWRGVMQE